MQTYTWGKSLIELGLVERLKSRRVLSVDTVRNKRKETATWYALTTKGRFVCDYERHTRRLRKTNHIIINGAYLTFEEAEEFISCWNEERLGQRIRCYSLKSEFDLSNPDNRCRIQFSSGVSGSNRIQDEIEDSEYLREIYALLNRESNTGYVFQPVGHEREPFFRADGTGLGFFNACGTHVTFSQHVKNNYSQC